MSVLPYQDIAWLCKRDQMVEPYTDQAVAFGMTYGAGPAGYDVRIAESVAIEPQGFYLASTIERFAIPDDLIARVCDKSSWARRGLTVQNTVIEPGWQGFLTMELINHSRDLIIIEAGMPIAQIIFEELTRSTTRPYRGKYQNQEAGPQPARRDAA